MAWQHCDQVAYYWQRGVEFLFKFTVYLCIKLHSFINDLHMYNKRCILISYQLARRNTRSEFCLHFSFSFIIYNRIFITNFFLFTYKS